MESPSVGPLSVIAGGLFVLYAFSKGYLTTVVVVQGWQFAGLSPQATALLVHVFEGVPLEIMALGLASFHVRSGARGPLARAGISVAIAGFGATILSHVAEHLAGLVAAPIVGSVEVVWAYYASWLVLYLGLAAYGLALVSARAAAGWLPYLLVVLLPLVVVVGLAVVALGLFTLAGTFRVTLGLAWVLVGRRFHGEGVSYPRPGAQPQ